VQIETIGLQYSDIRACQFVVYMDDYDAQFVSSFIVDIIVAM